MDLSTKNRAVLVGLCTIVFFLGLAFLRVGFIDSLDLGLYDLTAGFRRQAQDNDPVVLVEIDDKSISRLGGWPWPRSVLAEGIRKIGQGRPEVIGLTLLLGGPGQEAAITELKALEELFNKTVLAGAGDSGTAFSYAIRNAKARLDHDAGLVEAIIEAGNVVLPVQLVGPETRGGERSGESYESLAGRSITGVTNPMDLPCPGADAVITPHRALLEAAKGIGHINPAADIDGKTRRDSLLLLFHGLYIPSYSLRLAAEYLNIPNDDIRAEIGSAVYLGSMEIPVASDSQMPVNFEKQPPAFNTYSYCDLLGDNVPAGVFKGKIVLVYVSAAGITDTVATPAAPYTPYGEFTAHAVQTILGKSFVKPAPRSVGTLAVLAVGLAIVSVFSRLRSRAAITAAFLMLLALMSGAWAYLFVVKGVWLDLARPGLQLVLGYTAVVLLSRTETGRSTVSESLRSSDTGNAIVFENWVKASGPMSAPVQDGDGLQAAGESACPGKASASIHPDGAAWLAGSGPAAAGGSAGRGRAEEAGDLPAAIGKYSIIKKLGKGAMGTVYLGRDPRINRTTAIKTVRFADEYEPEEVERMKKTFFREAESAGSLSHPNIVTIYDAGEDGDMAYIAMEYLDGEAMDKHTGKGGLLPIRRVIDYVADIADALQYAHDKGIVHRDIKPANIMLPAGGVPKITDFGIARMAATSQTRTGVVKGTPYYMSPEQFTGEKVDGRSDVFSLGVVLFQLLTGELPFCGDNPPALMHQIMNVRHPDPREYNPRVFKPLVAIIDRALEKDRERRYQKASLMAGQLRGLAKRIDAFLAQKKAATTQERRAAAGP